jgi:hypothetical protein
MKDLFKIKYEMHKGVNYLFYAIVIGIGIAIGLGFKFLSTYELPNYIQDFLKNLII